MTNREVGFATCRELIESDAHLGNRIRCLFRGVDSQHAFELASKIAQYSVYSRSWPYKVQRSDLAEWGRAFHNKAGTLTREVSENINRIAAGGRLLLVAHQPNLFPSLGVIVPFILLASLAKSLEKHHGVMAAPVYLIVDYDSSDDRRFRTARFPDPSTRGGSVVLRSCPRGMARGLMFQPSRPSMDALKGWREAIRQSVARMSAYVKASGVVNKPDRERYTEELIANEENAAQMATESYERATTLAQFNSYFLSRLVNIYWNTPITFLPGHIVHANNMDAFTWIVENSERIISLTKDAQLTLLRTGLRSSKFFADSADTLLWFLCSACRKRVTIRKSGKNLEIRHLCSGSGKEEVAVLPAERLDTLAGSIYPKVLADNILDAVAIRKAGGTGYIGQAEHVVVANYVMERMGIPVPPQIVCGAIGLQCGIAELYGFVNSLIGGIPNESIRSAVSLSCLGHASALYYLVSLGAQRIKLSWETFYEEWKSAHRVNSLTGYPASLPGAICNDVKTFAGQLCRADGNDFS